MVVRVRPLSIVDTALIVFDVCLKAVPGVGLVGRYVADVSAVTLVCRSSNSPSLEYVCSDLIIDVANASPVGNGKMQNTVCEHI